MLLKNAQMQVELWGITLAGSLPPSRKAGYAQAAEIFWRERIYAFPPAALRRNKPAPYLTRRRMKGGVATNKERLLPRLRAETLSVRSSSGPAKAFKLQPAQPSTTACRHAAETVRRPDNPAKRETDACLPVGRSVFQQSILLRDQ
jgi:hypothetical protein